MSTEITVAFVQQYKDNVILLSQQKGSLLRGTVREDYTKGKAFYFERVGATTAVRRVTRHGDTPLVDTPHSRRRVSPFSYEWADLVDDPDKVRMLIRPESTYAINAAYAMGRAIDDAITDAAHGNSYEGEDGATVTALPGAQMIAVGATGLTVAKLLAARTILGNANVDKDDPRTLVHSPAMLQYLLANTAAEATPVASTDYNTIHALAKGEIDTFMGYKFIEMTRLPMDITHTTNRVALLYTRNGMGLMVGEDVKTKISERADKSYSVQVFVSMDIGATRIEDAKVVEIEALTTD
jgi:hypothetical protein